MEDAVGSRPTALEVKERSQGFGEGGEEKGVGTEGRELFEPAVVSGIGGSNFIENPGDFMDQLLRAPSFSVVVHGGYEI